MLGESADLARVAHADAWQEIGRGFEGTGGGVSSGAGLRLMASGLPHPQWNTGDVTSSGADVEFARDFYALHGVPWGLRVPPAMPWRNGRRLLTLRLMGVRADDFAPADTPGSVVLRVAAMTDLPDVLAADSAAFRSDPNDTRGWVAQLLATPDDRIRVCVALVDRTVVGTGYAVFTDGHAGRAVYLAGVAVVPGARRQGIGAAVSTWLVGSGFASGATLAHLHADDERAARLYTSLGFADTGSLDVYGEI